MDPDTEIIEDYNDRRVRYYDRGAHDYDGGWHGSWLPDEGEQADRWCWERGLRSRPLAPCA